MQKLTLQEKIPSETLHSIVLRVGTMMKSFKVEDPLDIEDKIDEIVESLNLNRFREFNPVLGISRIKDGEVHIDDMEMEHVDNIEEEEGVVFYLMLLRRERRRSEEDVFMVRGTNNFPQSQRKSRSTPNSPAKTQDKLKAPLQRSRSATDPLMRTLDPSCCHEQYNTCNTRTRRLKCSHTR